MKPVYENIPSTLKALDRWVVWKLEDRDGKTTKPPYIATTGPARHALVNVATTWRTFADAEQAFRTGKYDGVGFVLGNGIIGIDVDHASSEMVAEALSLGTYTEWSPSGTGVHVIGRSPLVVKGHKKGAWNSTHRAGTSRSREIPWPVLRRIFWKFLGNVSVDS